MGLIGHQFTGLLSIRRQIIHIYQNKYKDDPKDEKQGETTYHRHDALERIMFSGKLTVNRNISLTANADRNSLRSIHYFCGATPTRVGVLF